MRNIGEIYAKISWLYLSIGVREQVQHKYCSQYASHSHSCIKSTGFLMLSTTFLTVLPRTQI